MKYLFTSLLFIFHFTIAIAQTSKSNADKAMLAVHTKQYPYWNSAQQDSLCLLGLDSARRDLARGYVKYYLIGDYPSRLNDTYNFISSLYSLDFERAYCTSESDFFCYNRIIDSLLDAKHHGQFWKKAYSKVDSMQQLGLLDRFPMYKGGVKNQNKEFAKILKQYGLNPDRVKVGASVVVDSTGRTTILDMIYVQPKSQEDIIKKAILSLQNWLPGIVLKKYQTEETMFDYNIK